MKELAAQDVQVLPDVHTSQLAGQLTQLPPTAAVLGGQTLTARLVPGEVVWLKGSIMEGIA